MPTSEEAIREFGEAVRRVRTARGLSLERLGLESELARTYVEGVERGQRNPSLETIHKLATALDVPIRDLFDPHD